MHDSFPSPPLPCFRSTLDWSPPSADLLQEASEAAVAEHRESVRQKRLTCRGVRGLEGDASSIFVLDVGPSLDFDWSWEGAIACREVASAAIEGDEDAPAEARGAWSGEVVEADETGGRLYVRIDEPTRPPCLGRFVVKPFEFLALLRDAYRGDDFAELRRPLPARLHAAESLGGDWIPPRRP